MERGRAQALQSDVCLQTPAPLVLRLWASDLPVASLSASVSSVINWKNTTQRAAVDIQWKRVQIAGHRAWHTVKALSKPLLLSTGWDDLGWCSLGSRKVSLSLPLSPKGLQGFWSYSFSLCPFWILCLQILGRNLLSQPNFLWPVLFIFLWLILLPPWFRLGFCPQGSYQHPCLGPHNRPPERRGPSLEPELTSEAGHLPLLSQWV